MDLHTLHIEHTCLLGTLTLLTIGNSAIHRNRRGAGFFAAFTCTAFVGALLITLRGLVPPGPSIVLGAGLFSVAYVLLQRAFADFYETDGLLPLAFQVLLAMAQFAVLLVWGVLHPETAHRLIAYSLLLAAQTTIAAGFLLSRSGRAAVLWSGRIMALLLLALSAVNIYRALDILRFGAPAQYLSGSPSINLVVLLTSILQGTVVIAFVWMTAARLLEDLEEEATTDPLTGLLNRRALQAHADRELHRTSRRCGTAAILIDLDAFKSINDQWGHHAGDAVLRAVASRLDSQLRPGDHLGRIGGDEFVALLPDTSESEALRLAALMRSALEELRCGTGPEATDVIAVRGSFGLAHTLQPTDWHALLRHCDDALYRVKDLGGNHVLSASPVPSVMAS